MQRYLRDVPLIDNASDLERRRQFKWSLKVRAGRRRCVLLAIYRSAQIVRCGLCGAPSQFMFLARVLHAGETLVGEACCAHRDTNDWDQQVSLLIGIDLLKSERVTIRRAIADRELHLERAYSLLAGARWLRDSKFDFQHEYPASITWELGLLARGLRSGVIDGILAWDGEAHETIKSSIAFLGELDHLAFYDDDPDPEADPDNYIRFVARRCERLSGTLQLAAAKVEAGKLFFAPTNIARLPDLMNSEEIRKTITRLRQEARRA
jgi:hypothetical protein